MLLHFAHLIVFQMPTYKTDEHTSLALRRSPLIDENRLPGNIAGLGRGLLGQGAQCGYPTACSKWRCESPWRLLLGGLIAQPAQQSLYVRR